MEQRRSSKSPSTLYDADFALWVKSQTDALRDRRWQDVDVEHLIEEIDDLASRDRRELASRISTLMVHLLKVEFQPARDASRSWWSTIDEQAEEIRELLSDMPSLQREVRKIVEARYPVARRRALQETGLEAQDIPEAIPARVQRNVQAAVENRDFELNRPKDLSPGNGDGNERSPGLDRE
ncbi:MAG: DUF29 domain-containing protein [Candidatus Eremiobacteraeota bacterium]|nr:DUF29 domain-containing protein [Candidatus Eremiobacteraeota bacterium]MBC5804239.1 DUF29 domain-containing protein [Candidatus Eremiobacteraeota bacterium]MBC5821691.1 DUF29 domain-containing protein [Candidatus Eremiobacteraeota bacterium]